MSFSSFSTSFREYLFSVSFSGPASLFQPLNNGVLSKGLLLSLQLESLSAHYIQTSSTHRQGHSLHPGTVTSPLIGCFCPRSFHDIPHGLLLVQPRPPSRHLLSVPAILSAGCLDITFFHTADQKRYARGVLLDMTYYINNPFSPHILLYFPSGTCHDVMTLFLCYFPPIPTRMQSIKEPSLSSAPSPDFRTLLKQSPY